LAFVDLNLSLKQPYHVPQEAGSKQAMYCPLRLQKKVFGRGLYHYDLKSKEAR